MSAAAHEQRGGLSLRATCETSQHRFRCTRRALFVGPRVYLGGVADTPNPNDIIRRQILRYFYDRNEAATSKRGKKGSAVKVSDVKRELKDAHGLKQQQVISNLNYLLDRDWVKEIEIKKEFSPGRGATTVESVTSFYEITARGIDRVEGGSEFETRERYGDLNVNATGANVITLGDGNIVNAAFSDLRYRPRACSRFDWWGPESQSASGPRRASTGSSLRRSASM
jgi:predicted transcriptional regulator